MSQGNPMAFDPTKPQNGDDIDAVEIRTQFNPNAAIVARRLRRYTEVEVFPSWDAFVPLSNEARPTTSAQSA